MRTSKSTSNANISNFPASLREKLAEEAFRKNNDALKQACKNLTPTQKLWVLSFARQKIAEGGNQSGKTWAAVIDFLLEALGLHPVLKWKPSGNQPTWRGWYATVTFELFSQQGWEHFKRLLLFPGESVQRLPTRRIQAIGWDKKDPERPTYLKLKRTDTPAGAAQLFAEVWIKSYDQGVGTFQSAALNRVHLDEECPRSIYDEVQVRGIAKGGRISVSATPILGVDWLTHLREAAEAKTADVYHARFDTRDNPAADPKMIAEVTGHFKARPELIDLRLGGYPLAMEGLVYNDLVFTKDHVCDPFIIPGSWTRYRVIDPSWRNCACVWFAVAPKELEYVIYRDYLGESRTIRENCQHIVGLSRGESIEKTWIDRNYCNKHEETQGEKIIEIYRKNDVACIESVPVGIIPGIHDTYELLGQLVETVNKTGTTRLTGKRPRLRVFRTCENFLEERRRYRWPDAREKGNEGPQNPVDRDNHCLKCFAYFWAAKPRWVQPSPIMPPPGSMGELLVKDRMAAMARRKRL